MRVTIEDPGGHRVIIDPDEQRAALEKTARAAEPEWDGTSIEATLVKSSPELRYSLHVAYPALRDPGIVASDGFRDVAGPAVLEKAAWTYLSKSPKVGLWHEPGDRTVGAGTVVESYVYRGPDWPIRAVDGSEQVVKAGDWMVGIQWNEDTWPMLKDGRVGGVSMSGRARRRLPSADTLKNLRS